MDQRYFEYHQIVESFVLGQLSEDYPQPIGQKINQPFNDTLSNTFESETELHSRMRKAFINVLREEMLP